MYRAPSPLVSTVTGLTRQQRQAIREAMRTFVEEDLARGVPPDRVERCDACGGERPAAGFVAYGEARFCNDCATQYEISRTAGGVRDADDFMRRRRARRAARSR
ncbi:MAG TPA: hypothetical protein VNM43_05955 [Dehalococcoidia bacterium]|nr:hypothetical protein [Dehalococcoidia bacterium]